MAKLNFHQPLLKSFYNNTVYAAVQKFYFLNKSIILFVIITILLLLLLHVFLIKKLGSVLFFILYTVYVY